MSEFKGEEIILYAYEDLNPIGCEETCILTVTANEIITTTKGSGRATNREYGGYDWNVQSNGILGARNFFKTDPSKFADDIVVGRKIVVKIAVRDSFYFGIGIITSCTITGTSGEFAKYDITISGDGELMVTGDLINDVNEPKIIQVIVDDEDGEYVDTNLIDAKIIAIFYKNQSNEFWRQMNTIDYTFDDDTGTINIDEDVIGLPAEIKIFYVAQ